MVKPEELDALAERYLDLFEAEDSAVAADPAMGEALDRMTRAWIEIAQAGWAVGPRVWNAVSGGVPRGSTASESAGVGKPDDTRAAHGAAPAAAASGGGTGDLAALRARLEDLERQLAELEPAAERGTQPRPGTGSGRP